MERTIGSNRLIDGLKIDNLPANTQQEIDNINADILQNTSDISNLQTGKADLSYVNSQDLLKEDKANKGIAGGYASLDGGGKIPSSQLPSYVDDVLEFPTIGDFPIVGETGKIYVAIDTNLTYRWTGSIYVELISDIGVWKGPYNNTISYVKNDKVSYLGSSYICTNATTGNLPTDIAFWDILALKGTDGTNGTNGTNGANGRGITNLELLSTVGLIKTYRITYSDSTTFDYFTTDGVDGVDGINGINGTNGVNGRGIVSCILTSGTHAPGTTDTYTFTYTDTTTSTFSVYNGLNGTGTGDMMKSDNLSGLTNYPQARQNLGLEIGVNVEPAKGIDDFYITHEQRDAYGDTLSTGWNGAIGLTQFDSTHISVSASEGFIIYNTGVNSENPIINEINYLGDTNIAITNIATQDITYFLVNVSGVLYQQNTYPTPTERRNNLFIGRVAHPNRTSITAVVNTPDMEMSPMSQLRDLQEGIDLRNSGIVISANGANLSFNTTLGKLIGLGINATVDILNPNQVTISAKVPASFFYRTQLGGVTGLVSVLTPGFYDLGGVITAIPTGGDAGANRATNIRVYQFSNGNIVCQYGQQYYTSLANAIAGIPTETFVKFSNVQSNAVLIGIISVRRASTVLNSTTFAQFTSASMFGEVTSSTNGISTTTLQQAYDNSVTPEILTNATNGALSVKRGSVSDTDIVFEVVNGAGSITSSINGNGVITGTVVNTGKSVNTASGTTTDLGAMTGNYGDITGTTTITSLGTANAGITRSVDFTGSLTLTYNATSLKLPTSANIITQPGDKAIFVSEGAGNWDCISYQRKSGSALVGGTGNGTPDFILQSYGIY